MPTLRKDMHPPWQIQIARGRQVEYSENMRTVQEIEAALRRMSLEERAAFRAWYAEFDAQEWDRQIETDVADGRLDWLIDEARRDRQQGRCTDR